MFEFILIARLLTSPMIDDEVETLKEAKEDAGGNDGWRRQYEWRGATLRDPGEIVDVPRFVLPEEAR